MAITPGPNNVLLANSGLRFGLRRTAPLVMGIQAGVFVQNLVVAAGLGALFISQPWLQLVLKIIGSAYVLWLAWHSLRAAGASDEEAVAPIGFLAAAAFQFANPKSWLGSIASATAFLPAGEFDPVRVVAIALVAALVGTPCNIVWTLFGVGLKRLLARPQALMVVNRVLAALLACTIVLFWFPASH